MQQHPLVGAWRVTFVGAPTPYHMYTFHADGTVIQSNPPRGNSQTSDTNLHGVWEARDGKVYARLEEWRMDQTDPKNVTVGVVQFEIVVDGDTFAGPSGFKVLDANSKTVEGPYEESLSGQRVKLHD